MASKKVTVVGAGFVGSTAAQRLVENRRQKQLHKCIGQANPESKCQ